MLYLFPHVYRLYVHRGVKERERERERERWWWWRGEREREPLLYLTSNKVKMKQLAVKNKRDLTHSHFTL